MKADAATQSLTPAELGIDAFHELFPWPAELERFGDPMPFLWVIELDASPSRLWPLVCDTSRINRELGLARMDIREVDGVVHGVAVHGGRRHEWVEAPWDWEAERSLSVVRVYQRGWMHCVRSIYYLEPVGSGTRLYVYFGWVPRGALGGLAVKLGMSSLEAKYREVMGRLAKEAGSPLPQKFVQPPPGLAEAARARLDAHVQRLRDEGVVGEVVDRLVELVRSCDDFDLDRLQPRRLAREWGLDERSVLSGFLHATRCGLLQLSWDVVCPLCRGSREQSDALAGVPADGACEVCNVQFSTSGEHAVEVSFRVHPSIRDVPKLFYCTAEPATKMHIRLQLRVGAGERRPARAALPAGSYRVRSLEDGRRSRLLVVKEGCSEELSVDLAGEEPMACAPGARVSLRNDDQEDKTFVVEELSWRDDLLLPEHLLSFQDFRDLFSSEYIASDVRLAVGRQAVLFTDIVGSTRFYAENGDPDAFVQVRDHFREVYAIVREQRGAVVKTIGDAVMAVFSASKDAVEAARDIHRVFDGSRGPIRLRISVHVGPCIAVNLNSTMDFFGGTVNLAAKLQACAEACEVALSEDVYDAPGVVELIEASGGTTERVELELAAIDAVVPVVRWCLGA